MSTEPAPDVRIREVLAMVAPGTALRDGLERILRGRTGALIVLGWDRTVEQVANGVAVRMAILYLLAGGAGEDRAEKVSA